MSASLPLCDLAPSRQNPIRFAWIVLSAVILPSFAGAQPLGKPDRESPGDEMIQAYLADETKKLEAQFADDLKSLDQWQANRERYVEEYYYMLGLSPRPEKTPLHVKITGKIEGEGYVVENLHYQSRPQLYVTANLYRPGKAKEGDKLPAVLYVCGHSGRGRNGNKVAYQSHGIWFARHGYVCLVVDTLQLGEIAAKHHGTYNLKRWWWHSRGYTPAGVEAWNGIRGIDYLVSRDDVDPERIAVTGISGGGAATFWVAAADGRVNVAVPVSGMADLQSYVPNRVINGHCDCMFLYNTFQWPWTRIAGLVAPRPMLFINSDNDPIFPMDANERITNRLERLYSLYGASDCVDTVVSVGGHAYRQDIRQAAFRFINAHLKGDAHAVIDSERDIVSEGGNPGPYLIEPEKLRAFPTDADLPRDERNTKIDEHFVPIAKVAPPQPGKFHEWKKPLLAELKRVSFGYFPEKIEPAEKHTEGKTGTNGFTTFTAESSLPFRMKLPFAKDEPVPTTIAIVVSDKAETGLSPNLLGQLESHGLSPRNVVLCEPRGLGDNSWTRKNPPNYVERSHALLGRTVDTGRVLDVIAGAKYLKTQREGMKLYAIGKGAGGLIVAYAALLDDSIDEVMLIDPPTTHMDSSAPQFLNVLRVCDVPDALGMLAPRPLMIVAKDKDAWQRTAAAYEAAGATEHFQLK